VGFLTKVFGKHSLDDRLLSGELSPDSGEGGERAGQLLDPHHREVCARALRDLVDEAQRPAASLFNANLRVKRLAIRENQALILTLARELEELPAVDPRGVILADRLVTDGASPVYGIAEDDGQILAAVERAREALKAS
jgi:hypothetical protein